MKKFFLLTLLLSLSVCLSAQQLKIDEKKATVSFLFLDDDVDGTFSELKFSGNLNFQTLETSSISGSVVSETIDTDIWLRNRHLRRKYFQSDDYPLLKFRSNLISTLEFYYSVEGSLIIKDIEKTVTFKMVKKEAELILETSINASDFDIFIHDEAFRNKVDIEIRLPYSF